MRAKSESMLQWSHVFSDMVRNLNLESVTTCVVLQWSHVFSDMVSDDADRTAALAVSASMEPCLFRHGKGKLTIDLTLYDMELQWSHVFSDMVSSAVMRATRDRAKASMEPCLFRHGKGDRKRNGNV